MAEPRKEVDQLSTAYWGLDTIILREGKDMLWELLAQLIPKRRPFRKRAVQAAKTDTHKPQCDTGLSEVYYAHAAFHGANKLLPVDALPTCLSVHEPATPKADLSLQ